MTESVLNVAASVFVYGLVVAFHEFGHYGVGRWVAGIPASKIKVVLLDFPQHVALRDEEDWIRPREQPRYGEIYAGYDAEAARTKHVDLYTAGGLVGQAVGVAAAVGILLAVGGRAWAELFVDLSVLLTASYFLFNLGASFRSARNRRYTGDFSALWTYSPPGTIAVVLFFVVVHGGLYLLL
ncbi:hypothetical protein [Halorubrum sp. AS12]|uniref:hypothetical protein n=1 Tax=Halorubrum sp. AS12 TaxID=3409687 RepID=UPI003DA7900D